MGEDNERSAESTSSRADEPLEELAPVGDGEADTEGHSLRPQFPIPPAIGRTGPGEHGIGPGEHLIRGDGTPADFLDDRDTEGHIEFRRLPSEGGE